MERGQLQSLWKTAVRAKAVTAARVQSSFVFQYTLYLRYLSEVWRSETVQGRISEVQFIWIAGSCRLTLVLFLAPNKPIVVLQLLLSLLLLVHFFCASSLHKQMCKEQIPRLVQLLTLRKPIHHNYKQTYMRGVKLGATNQQRWVNISIKVLLFKWIRRINCI